MTRTLRQAHLYGRLIERNGKLYHPGGGSNSPICTHRIGARLVELGLLVRDGVIYTLTPEGLRAAS